MKIFIWDFHPHTLHPLPWELHWSLPDPKSDPDHVPDLTWDLSHHCRFVWPALDSCLTLATALHLQVLCDGTLSGRPVSLPVLGSPLTPEFPSPVKQPHSYYFVDSKRERSILKISPFHLIYSFILPMNFSDLWKLEMCLTPSWLQSPWFSQFPEAH